MKTITFFNNKGGVGKTSLVYHLSWMYALNGLKVLALDLDPQANLTSMFLDEEALESLWPEGEHPGTILGSLRPMIRGLGDIAPPRLQEIGLNGPLFPAGISLVAGDLGLSTFEDKLSASWPLCSDGDEGAFRVISAFHRIIAAAGQEAGADVALVDVGPNLGAINRAVLIAADHVVIPLAPDLFSMQGLRNLGPALLRWRREWGERLRKNPDPGLLLPKGEVNPAGYVLMQYFSKENRPVKAFDRWMSRTPGEYRASVLGQTEDEGVDVGSDPFCLARLKHYRSLMPMAMEARRPMFLLKPADGAIGAHTYAVQACRHDFHNLAEKISTACGLEQMAVGAH